MPFGIYVPIMMKSRLHRVPLLTVLLATLLLAACGSAPPSRPVSSGTASPYLSGPSCIIDLAYRGVAFDRVADSAKSGGCGVETAISLRSEPTAELNRPVQLSCAAARQLALWVETVVQPAAQRTFGQRVKQITHYGGYACRGRTSNRSRLSEHAFGKAIDIAAFQLEDGQQVSVLKDWSDGGAKQRFLREITAGSCRLFSVVLTPNSNADHANHLHLDIGPWKLCSL
jgi:hypothetical protein